MKTFPELGQGINFDAAGHEESYVDDTLRFQTDGGYEITRPSSSRRPRREFSFQLTEVPQLAKEVLDRFYEDVRCSQHFALRNPDTGEVLICRFSVPIEKSYRGIGKTKLWTITVKVKEV